MRDGEILRLLNVFSLGRVFGCLSSKKPLRCQKTRPFLCDLACVLYPPQGPPRHAVWSVWRFFCERVLVLCSSVFVCFQ